MLSQSMRLDPTQVRSLAHPSVWLHGLETRLQDHQDHMDNVVNAIPGGGSTRSCSNSSINSGSDSGGKPFKLDPFGSTAADISTPTRASTALATRFTLSSESDDEADSEDGFMLPMPPVLVMKTSRSCSGLSKMGLRM